MAGARLDGYEDLLRKLTKLAQLRQVGAAVAAGAAHLAGQMKRYPPRKRITRKAVYGSSFVSGRQRRFFFYALKNGLIQVPYRRGQSPGSRNLKQTWTSRVYNSGLTGEAGTNTEYAPMVQGEGTQSRYHKAVGWKTEVAVLREEADHVVGLIAQAIERAIQEE